MPKETPGVLAMDGFQPITEGYQPGSQIIKGFVPLASGTPVAPPSGGSSASKPGQAAGNTATSTLKQ